MATITETPAKPRRRWLRFRLRTLLILVTVSGAVLGWVGWELEQVRKEKEVIAWVIEIGGEIGYRQELSFFSKDRWFGVRVTEANIHGRRTSNLSMLAKLKNLETINLCGTKASDLSPLSELKNLRKLDISYTKVIDLSPLAELENLETLHLTNAEVNDLSPLAEVKNLKALHLRKTQVSDEQVQELRQALPNCEIQL